MAQAVKRKSNPAFMVNDMKTLTLRVLLPTVLLVIAGSQLRIGGNALPIWISTLSLKNDFNPVTTLKLLIALELCLAVMLFFFGHRLVRLAQIERVAALLAPRLKLGHEVHVLHE